MNADKEVKIEVDTSNGKTYEVAFTRETSWTVDRHYGEDADGNRGTTAVFINSDTAVDLRVKVLDKYVSILEIGDTERIEIEEAIEKWMQQHEPDTESDSASENDEDDRDR